MGAEAKIAGPEVAPATSGGAAQLLPSDPTPVANDDGRSWIVLLAFVNLREGPSSSSRVIGEMPKGAKLRALDRERGWVQVTDWRLRRPAGFTPKISPLPRTQPAAPCVQFAQEFDQDRTIFPGPV